MEPLVDLASGHVVGTETSDGKAFDWSRVRGEDVGDCGESFVIHVADPIVDGEVEGDRPPEEAPPLGEDGGPHARFGGEEADDDAQHLIGKEVEEVEPTPNPLVRRLVLHLSRRRDREPARQWGFSAVLQSVFLGVHQWRFVGVGSDDDEGI